MAKFVARVTFVSKDGSKSETLYKKKKKKKRKVSKWLRPQERVQRRGVNALVAFGDELRYRHNRSNRKRRNGFLRDGNVNLMRAGRKGMKKLFRF